MQPTDNNISNNGDSETNRRFKDEFDQVVDKLKSSNNILVTISTDPTVDQFAACIGLTLVLNKIGKHANAVFSGKVPSTIDFLKPDKTLEKTTDSLRDFIIALDKTKADKLRYKVEDDVVKIFITPYKTSINEKDLEFSQGDFNVDAIVALGVQDKNHIDKAILNHGRILHDAAVISINIDKQSKLGSINWNDARASSLCEMVADVSMELDSNVFESQNATALLTGIVAETDRYSNEKAAPHTMSIAGLLMSAGASTQLVSTKLEEGEAKTDPLAAQDEGQTPQAKDAGLLQIEHPKDEKLPEEPIDIPKHEEPEPPVQETPITPPEEKPQDIKPPDPTVETPDPTPKIVHDPPELGGQLTANTVGEDQRYSGSTDPLSNMPDIPLLNRDDQASADSLLPPKDDSGLAKGKNLNVSDDQTLSDIEKAVDSPHSKDSPEEPSLDDARDAVMKAQATLNGDESRPEARQDIGSTSLGSDLHQSDTPPDEDLPPPPVEPEPFEANKNNTNNPPPPVPPPFMPDSN